MAVQTLLLGSSPAKTIDILSVHTSLFVSDKYMSQHGSSSQYAYYHEEDESTFHLVDTARIQKPPYQRGRFRQNQRNMRGRGAQRGSFNDRKGQVGTRNKWSKQMGMRNQKNTAPIKNRDASVSVRPDWVTIEEMDFPRLAKLSLPNVKDGEDMSVTTLLVDFVISVANSTKP